MQRKASSERLALAPARHRDAEQERNEKAREWRLPGDCADGGERLARLPHRCNRLTEAIDRSLKRRRHIRDPLPDLKSPLPDVRLAGGRDAIFHAFVDHEPPRAGPTAQGEAFAAAINPGNYGMGACDLHGAYARYAMSAGRIYSTTSSARAVTGNDEAERVGGQFRSNSQVPVCAINSRLLV